MYRTTRANVPTLCLAAFVTFTAHAVHADVTIREAVAVEGSGIMSLASMSGTTTTAISGRSSRIESDMKMNSRFARVIARGAGQATEVVRLDDDVVLELEMRKKRFRQSSVSARRAQLEQASQQLRQAQAQQPMSTGLDESQCDWSEPAAQLRKSGAKATIAGMSAQQVTVVVKQTCKLRQSAATCDVGISADQWLAPDFPAAREIQQFRTAYAQQLGLIGGNGAAGQQVDSLFGRYPASWAKVAGELRKLKGYPVKAIFTLEMEGAGCQGTSGPQGAGAQAPGAVAGQIAGMLFGRKNAGAQDVAGTEPSSATSTNAQVALRVSSELTSIDTAKLGAETFEAPAGFRKIDK